jgi:site-specific DNA recombinase
MPRKTRVRTVAKDGPLRVVAYIRVSTEEQARDGTSIENQDQKVRIFVELHDLNLIRVEADPGTSAKSLDRPGLKRCLDDLQRGRADGLVITKLDRLTRSLEDWSVLIKRYFADDQGPRLFSVSDSIDTRTASGRMVLNIIMSIAQWEREIISERTSDALQGKISRGERCGRIRYGYDLAADRKTLVPNKHEQEVISKLKAWRRTGWTYQGMVEELHRLGIETKDGGHLWFPATIHRILSRPIA